MILSTLLENEGIQSYLNAKEDAIYEGAKVFHEYPQKIKDYMMEHLDSFIVPGDIKATYTRMSNFVETSVRQILEELCTEITESSESSDTTDANS